jgi:hypothetical protein
MPSMPQLVGVVGIEPTLYLTYRILSSMCLANCTTRPLFISEIICQTMAIWTKKLQITIVVVCSVSVYMMCF